jgi:hypothetical protein
MRTSLVEIQAIEAHLLAGASLPEGEDIPGKVQWQQHTYDVVREYGRKQIKAELEGVHQQLFTGSAFWRFRRRIARYFR